jgi:hypothetical protein
MDQAAEPVPAQNARTSRFGRRIRASGRRLLLQCPVRTVKVVVVGVLAEDQPQVTFASDQHPVRALAAGTADQALRDRIRTRRPDRRPNHPHSDRGEYDIERHRELDVPVPDQELHTVSLTEPETCGFYP